MDGDVDTEGFSEGCTDGNAETLGFKEGSEDGIFDGLTEGLVEGKFDGLKEGCRDREGEDVLELLELLVLFGISLVTSLTLSITAPSLETMYSSTLACGTSNKLLSRSSFGKRRLGCS
jgi:hypothetical protein